jgi:hypothetical protein
MGAVPLAPRRDDDEENQNSDDEEPSEYKRIRLLDHEKTRWRLLACARHFDFGYPMALLYHGPAIPRSAFISAVVNTPLFTADEFESFETLVQNFKAWFAVKVVEGRVCLGFCTDMGAIKRLPGCEGAYIYDCTDGRIFASSSVSTTRIPMFRGVRGDVIGIGLWRGFGYITSSFTPIRKFQVHRRGRLEVGK